MFWEHDNVITWKNCRVTGTFLGVRSPPITGGFPTQRPVTRNYDAFFIYVTLRRYRAHYDVTVMNDRTRFLSHRLSPVLHFLAFLSGCGGGPVWTKFALTGSTYYESAEGTWQKY